MACDACDMRTCRIAGDPELLGDLNPLCFHHQQMERTDSRMVQLEAVAKAARMVDDWLICFTQPINVHLMKHLQKLRRALRRLD